MRRRQSQIAAGITHVQVAGEAGSDLDAARTAAAILGGLQGGVVMMLSTGDLAPLEAAPDLALSHLRCRAHEGERGEADTPQAGLAG